MLESDWLFWILEAETQKLLFDFFCPQNYTMYHVLVVTVIKKNVDKFILNSISELYLQGWSVAK